MDNVFRYYNGGELIEYKVFQNENGTILTNTENGDCIPRPIMSLYSASKKEAALRFIKEKEEEIRGREEDIMKIKKDIENVKKENEL
jgi:hypothetical protein